MRPSLRGTGSLDDVLTDQRSISVDEAACEAAFGRDRTGNLILAYMNVLAGGDTETLLAQFGFSTAELSMEHPTISVKAESDQITAG